MAVDAIEESSFAIHILPAYSATAATPPSAIATSTAALAVEEAIAASCPCHAVPLILLILQIIFCLLVEVHVA
eukprot:Skav218611  [mRNA]  locus=scaffold3208:67684:67938:- [translate_table: standard]